MKQPSAPTQAVCSSCLWPVRVMVVRPVLNYLSFIHCWHARGETPVHVSCLPPRLGFPGAVAPAEADFPNKNCPSPQAAHFCHTLQLLDAPRLIQPPCVGTRLRVVPYFFFHAPVFQLHDDSRGERDGINGKPTGDTSAAKPHRIGSLLGAVSAAAILQRSTT